MEHKNAIKGATILLSFALLFGGGVALVDSVLFTDPISTVNDAGCLLLTSWMAPTFCNPDPSKVEFNADNTDSLINSVYGNGITTQSDRNQTVINQKAHLNQSYGIGMARAKAISFEKLNNGSSLSNAQNSALSKINDFYGTVEDQTMTYRNREIVGLKASIDRINEAGNIQTFTSYNYCGGIDTKGVFDVRVSNIQDSSSNGRIISVNDVEIWNSTKQLKNGTEVKALGLNASVKQDSNDCSFGDAVNGNVTLIHPDPTKTGTTGEDQINVRDSQFETPEAYVNDPRWNEVFQRIDQNYQRSLDNVQPTIESIYNSYNAGDVNLSDLELGPLETLKASSTSYDSTGFYDYRTVSLAQMGLATNESYAFNVSWDGEKTEIGQLFVSESFNETLTVGETYQVNGEIVEIVYNPDGEKAVREKIDSNFTINRMTDKSSGETINSTRVQSVKWYTNNVSDLQAQIDRIDSLQKDQTQVQTFGDFLSGVGSWGDLTNWFKNLETSNAILLILTTLVVLVGLRN